MMRVYFNLFLVFLSVSFVTQCNCGIFDSFASFFENKSEKKSSLAIPKVAYESTAVDESFVREAQKLTGLAPSQLDNCQHLVVLKLQTSCERLNDEQVAKLAVSLLNCQSMIEGRTIYPCTEKMTLKQCTTNMDADTWNTYHLMTNRARAVCYVIRQQHFKAQTELAINRLSESAHEQMSAMEELARSQNEISKSTENIIKLVEDGHENLSSQQNDLKRAQWHSQLLLEENFNKLAKEKKLIIETHNYLTDLTKEVKNKLEYAASQLTEQAKEQKINHEDIIDDLNEIQKQTTIIFDKIDKSTKHMLEQSTLIVNQYEFTLKQLSQINHTVYSLVKVINTTKQTIEEKLGWLTDAVDGTDNTIERVYLMISHLLYLLLSMIACSFIQVPLAPRLFVLALVPLNLSLSLQNSPGYSMGFFGLTGAIVTAIALYFGVYYAVPKLKVSGALRTRTVKRLTNGHVNAVVSDVDSDPFEEHDSVVSIDRYRSNSRLESRFTPIRLGGDFMTRTGSPSSRSSTPSSIRKQLCSGHTRLGTPCKLSAVPGRDYCHRHQTGSSIAL